MIITSEILILHLSFYELFLENLECQISENNINIRTKSGEDFLDGDDGYDRPNWNLYFLDNTGIAAKAENSSRSPPQFEGYAIAVDGVAEQYFTKVKL